MMPVITQPLHSQEGNQEESVDPTPTAPVVSINWEARAKERRRQRLAHYKEVYQEYCRLKLSLNPKSKTPALSKFIEQLNHHIAFH